MDPDRDPAESGPRAPDTWLTDGWRAYADDGCAGHLPRPQRPPVPESGSRRTVHGRVPAMAVGALVVASGTAPLVVPDPWMWVAPALAWPAAVIWAVVSRDAPRRD